MRPRVFTSASTDDQRARQLHEEVLLLKEQVATLTSTMKHCRAVAGSAARREQTRARQAAQTERQLRSQLSRTSTQLTTAREKATRRVAAAEQEVACAEAAVADADARAEEASEVAAEARQEARHQPRGGDGRGSPERRGPQQHVWPRLRSRPGRPTRRFLPQSAKATRARAPGHRLRDWRARQQRSKRKCHHGASDQKTPTWCRKAREG